MKIQIEKSRASIRIDRRRIRSVLTRLSKHLNCSDEEVSLFFVDDETIQSLNKQYLKKDRPTNVLSFSLRDGEFSHINSQLLGDIVISVDTARKDAARSGFSVEQEIDFLIIHGLLHLLGYNHENTTEAEAKKMRKKERELMKLLNCSDRA